MNSLSKHVKILLLYNMNLYLKYDLPYDINNNQSNPYHSERGDLEAYHLTTSNHIDMVLPISRNKVPHQTHEF